MQVFRHVPVQSSRPCVLTIGNFDGVHIGHKALLARLIDKAASLRSSSAVLSFEPHPREFFSPAHAPARLSNLHDKWEQLAATGLNSLYLCRFNEPFAQLSARQFVERILVQGLHTQALIIGDDFRFGRGREGDFALLQQMGRQFGFQVEGMDTVSLGTERVSSSAVREALQAKDLAHASALLGRDFEITGRVLHGDKIGRRLGFPTANIRLKQSVLPLSGIFAVEVSGGPLNNAHGAASLGVRPTIGNALEPRLEIHVLDFDGNLYGERLRIRFKHFLRDEEKYASLDVLQNQIARDVAAVRDHFAALRH